MSGHSKWATIHRKKGLIDAQRGKIFQKLTKEIMVAAKSGSPDPAQNSALRLAVDKAKAQNMPKDNIENAIKKAAGIGDNVNYEHIVYEGYGPSGVAIMVDCLTDNKNRTAAAVRSTFTKHGGNLGTDGSVSYMFKYSGSIVVPSDYDENMIMETCLEAGVDNVEKEDETYLITTSANDFSSVKDALSNAGVSEFLECELTYVPIIYSDVDDETKDKVYKILDALDDIVDVQEVYNNLKEE